MKTETFLGWHLSDGEVYEILILNYGTVQNFHLKFSFNAFATICSCFRALF